MDAPDVPLVSQSPAMRQVCALVTKIALTDVPVLVRGEPGVGKGSVARAIHNQSRRAAGPFVPINCGGIREAALEEVLFGLNSRCPHSPEAVDRGLLESANTGTVFLANIERLPRWAQVRLGDVLQSGLVRRGAGLHPGRLEVRVIASTSCDLEALLAEGAFHSRLYYRLNVVTVHVPPLRQRQEDIRLLAERHLADLAARLGAFAGSNPYHLTQEAWECLLRYDWPGNLPELENVLARAVALADGWEIGSDAIIWIPRPTLHDRCKTISVPLAATLHEIERHVVEQVVQQCGGNKAAAARVLGLHRRTLYRVLEEGPA